MDLVVSVELSSAFVHSTLVEAATKLGFAFTKIGRWDQQAVTYSVDKAALGPLLLSVLSEFPSLRVTYNGLKHLRIEAVLEDLVDEN